MHKGGRDPAARSFPAPVVEIDGLDVERITTDESRPEIVVDDLVGSHCVDHLSGARQPLVSVHANVFRDGTAESDGTYFADFEFGSPRGALPASGCEKSVVGNEACHEGAAGHYVLTVRVGTRNMRSQMVESRNVFARLRRGLQS